MIKVNVSYVISSLTVSQALAKERLERSNYSVVGWYHSHPTFIPNPSLRDLETQSNFQQMFSKESGKPFIALILSPYSTVIESSTKSTLVSKFKCLLVSEQFNSQVIVMQTYVKYYHFLYFQGVYRIPIELSPKIIRREKLMFAVTYKLRDLCRKIRTNNNSSIDMFDRVKHIRGAEINYLQKVCIQTEQ